MGSSKIELFTAEQNEVALLAKALGHPARIAIIEHLISANQCINSDLVQELGLAQATISQHLQELKKIGIIKGTIDGASMCYCIDPEVWTRLREKLEGLFDQYNPQGCC